MPQKTSKPVVVIDLGGSILFPNLEGFNLLFLKKLKKFLAKESQKFRLILIIGGGKVCRFFQNEAKKLGINDNNSLDWIGIKTTQLNAEFLKHFLNVSEPIIAKETQKISWKEGILIGSGWHPGNSTDLIAFKLAKRFKAKRVIIATNVPYIYDKDINLNKTAKKIENLSWEDYLSLIKGKKWKPGMSVPIDPEAAKLAKKIKMTTYFLNGNDLKNMKKALQGKNFQGTKIS